MDQEKKRLIEKLRNKEYRDAFVSEIIDTGVPFQIYALREQRKWTQKELGRYTGMAQETISRLEDPNYAKLTLKTLKRLASAFRVALMVRFIPFSELVEWELNLKGGSLEVLSFEEDPYFSETSIEDFPEILKSEQRYSPSHPSVIFTDIKQMANRNKKGDLDQKEIQTPAQELMRMR